MVGKTISHYRILEKLGEGGMGVVYKARDSHLKRFVALKVLPPEKVADPERKHRFVQEARAASALNHPNIVTVYDIDQSDGVDFIAMEYVEGKTLDELIGRKGLKLNEALKYAVQIADALAKAHAAGIVHRDLKPGNVMVTGDGRAKVLDFGLAKLTEAAPESQDGTTQTEHPATESGMIVGTVAYMSPEQAEGKKVDARSDIFSFGSLLYEMVTGRRAFRRDSPALTLAAILYLEPPPLLAEVPRDLERLIARCLRKEPERRIQHMDDLKVELEEATVESQPGMSAARLLLDEPPPVSPRHRPWLLWAGMALFSLTIVALAWLHFRETPPPSQLVRFQIPPPEKSTWVVAGIPGTLSPDGRQLALISVGPDGISRLSVHALDSLVSRRLAGTEGIQGIPIWSPDGRFLVFSVGEKLKKLASAGGSPQTLCDVQSDVAGGFWTNDDKIVFGSNSGLRQVAAGGGAVTALTSVDRTRGELYHIRPFPLPDGRHIVYGRYATDAAHCGVYVRSLDAKPEEQDARTLLAGTPFAEYVSSPGSRTGYLLFARETTLVAQRFDPKRLELTGDAIPISGLGVGGAFSTSTTGVLAYQEGGVPDTTLTWLDRQGRVIGTVGEPHPYDELALSPDGSRVAVFRRDDIGENLWLIEFARGSSGTRLTTDPANESYPVWSPDGKQIALGSNRGGQFDLYRKSANGSGVEELLLKSGEFKAPLDWSRDGRFLLYSLRVGAQTDLWILPLEGERKPTPYLATKFDESHGRFSPDGRWVVYVSDVSGKDEIYVSPFSTSTAANAITMVSTGGGRQPRWRRDGGELYYLSPDSQLMAVEVTTSPSFKAGVPKPLFPALIRLPTDNSGATWTWDVTADGQRFLINREPALGPITVVLNWQAGLKK